MAKQHYGKKPRTEITEPTKKTAAKSAKKPAAKKVKKPAAKFEDYRKRLIYVATGAVLFVIIASVALIAVYTIKTRSTKIDLYAENIGYFEAADEIQKIYDKYGFNSSYYDADKLSKTDLFNLYALSFRCELESYNAGEKDKTRETAKYDAFYAAGSEEQVPININGDVIPVLYEVSEHGYTITINGEKFTSEYLAKPDTSFYTADYYSSSYNKIIFCQDLDESGEGRVFLYYYNGEKGFYCGAVDTKADLIAISDSGFFSVPLKSAYLQPSYYYAMYYMDDFNNYSLIPFENQTIYNYYQNSKVFVRKDFAAYGATDLEGAKFNLYEMETIELVGTDENGFIKFVTVKGEEGYLHVVDYNYIEVDGELVPASELFFGLADGK